MSKSLIKPQTLKGFRDSLPGLAMAREELTAIAREVYRSYGFSPIDTPALEYSEILLGKGGDETDKQMFRFQDQGDRDVAMRFDLTIPFARFAAQHLNDIGTPFKRYHIAPVWRAEKPQRGRYREFIQCDFDTIGTDSNIADIETLLVIHDLITRIGFERFTIRVNHRQLLNGLLETLNLAEQSTGVLRALDKLPKIGRDNVLTELTSLPGVEEQQAAKVLAFAELSGSPSDVLNQVESLLNGNERGLEGVNRLRQLFDAVRTAGVADERVALDVSIARGLDYYTGLFTRHSWTTCRTSAASAQAVATTTSQTCLQPTAPRSRCQPWSRPAPRRNGGTGPVEQHINTSICADRVLRRVPQRRLSPDGPPTQKQKASQPRFTPSRVRSKSNCSTQTAKASASP
ncbi:MAG: HisS family protein [Planctomycetaceae bacterium]